MVHFAKWKIILVIAISVLGATGSVGAGFGFVVGGLVGCVGLVG